MDQNPPENENQIKGLPLITQETRDKLLEEIGLGQEEQPSSLSHPNDQMMREALDLHSGKHYERMMNKGQQVEKVTLGSFDDIADVKPDLIRALRDGIEVGLGFNEPLFSERYARGIGLVIKAFHVESDYRLISDMERLTDEDILKIKDVISSGIKSGSGLSSSTDPFTRALNRPRIPASQQYLREIIDGPPKAHPMFLDAEYKTGAGLMYRAMNIIWHRLYPGQNPSAPPPSTPSPSPSQGY